MATGVRLDIDGRSLVEEADDVGRRLLRVRGIRDEGKDAAGLRGGEDGRLEDDKEVVDVVPQLGDPPRTDPEDEGDDPEVGRLRQREESVRLE